MTYSFNKKTHIAVLNENEGLSFSPYPERIGKEMNDKLSRCNNLSIGSININLLFKWDLSPLSCKKNGDSTTSSSISIKKNVYSSQFKKGLSFKPTQQGLGKKWVPQGNRVDHCQIAHKLSVRPLNINDQAPRRSVTLLRNI